MFIWLKGIRPYNISHNPVEHALTYIYNLISNNQMKVSFNVLCQANTRLIVIVVLMRHNTLKVQPHSINRLTTLKSRYAFNIINYPQSLNIES